MFSILIRHSFLQFTRSASFSKNVATLVLLGFLCLLFGGYFLVAAFLLDTILQKVSGLQTTFPVLCEILIYYFMGEAFLRYFLQSLPVLNLQQYLHLPIRRSSLVHFVLLRSFVHPFNFLTAIFFLPYTLQILIPQLGSAAAWSWWGSMVLISLLIHNGVFFFKKQLDDKPLGTILLIALVLLLGAIQYFDWFSLGALTSPVFAAATDLLWLPLILATLLVFAYFLNFLFLRRHTYPEAWSKNQEEKIKAVPALGILSNLGISGELVGLEIRLILRHKRTRSLMVLTAFFLFYGLIFYRDTLYMEEMPGLLIFVGVLITGMFMMNYGQFLLSWNSSHYDFLLSKPVPTLDYLKAKFYLMVAVGLLTFVLTIPYVYFGWKILLINTAMLLFNFGVNIYVIMNMSMWSPKRISLEKGSIFNYEGLGAAQWVMAIPILLLPYVFYLPFSLTGNPEMGLMAIGAVGLLGIFFHKPLLAYTTRRLESKKYSISHTFRNEQ